MNPGSPFYHSPHHSTPPPIPSFSFPTTSFPTTPPTTLPITASPTVPTQVGSPTDLQVRELERRVFLLENMYSSQLQTLNLIVMRLNQLERYPPTDSEPKKNDLSSKRNNIASKKEEMNSTENDEKSMKTKNMTGGAQANNSNTVKMRTTYTAL